MPSFQDWWESQQQPQPAPQPQEAPQPDKKAELADYMKSQDKRAQMADKFTQATAAPEALDTGLIPEEKPALNLTGGFSDGLGAGTETTSGAAPLLASEVIPLNQQTQQGLGQWQMPSFSTPGLDLQQAAIADAARAGTLKAAEEGAYYDRIQKEMQQQQKADIAAADAERQRITQFEDKLSQSMADVSKLSVDKNKFWADKTTGDKIGLGIGLLLGAFGAANTGVNSVASMIDKAIDRDINIQNANIASQKENVLAQRGILSSMRQNFSDSQAARTAAKAAYLENAKLEIQKIASKYAGPEIQAKAAGLIGQLETLKQGQVAELQKRAMATMPVGPDVNPEMLTPEQRDRYVPGYGLAITKEGATKANEAVGNFRGVNDTIDQLVGFTKITGSSVTPTMRSQANTIASVLKAQLRLPLLGPGAVSDTERAILNDIVADPTSIFSLDANNKIKLETLKKTLKTKLDGEIRQFGLRDPNATLKDKLGFKPE